MACASLCEIPNAFVSKYTAFTNAPYAADYGDGRIAGAQRDMGASEFATRAIARKCFNAAGREMSPGRAKQSALDRTIRPNSVDGSSVRAFCCARTGKSSVYSSISVAKMKLAAAPIVGWSKNNVSGNSTPKSCVSAPATSVAAIESNPVDINGVSMAALVPMA